MRRSIPKLILVVALWLAAPLVAQETSVPDATQPDPKLTPDQVVAIQLKALKNNRYTPNDRGIAVTFNFASPANRRVTGPLPRFTEMMRNPLYDIMLNYERYESGKMEMSEDNASQRITLVDAQDNKAIFVWVLSKQKEAPYKDCWMTDSVYRISADDTAPMVAGLTALPLWTL